MQKKKKVLDPSVPYRPELRTFFGSVTSTLLFQQLEFYFSRHPGGFYKCAEPCSSPYYRPGDSWLEELKISPKAFRTAFDTMGTRYKSKAAYKQAAEAGDPFNGLFYLSYHDRQKGYTFFVRNAAKVQNLFDTLTTAPASPAKVVQIDRGSSSNCPPGTSSNGPKGTSITAQQAVPQYTENTQETTSESSGDKHQSNQALTNIQNKATVGTEIGETMKAEDLIAQVKAKKPVVPTKITTTVLAAAWSREVAAATGKFVPELTMQQKGMLSHFLKRVGDKPLEKLVWCVQGWSKFTAKVRLATGIMTHPGEPYLPYLLKHVDVAANVLNEPVAVTTDWEAPTPPTPVHSSAKPEADKPATAEEVLKIVGNL